jgi:hypothetical protein
MGFMLGTSPDLYVVGGTVPEPMGLETAGLSSDSPTVEKNAARTAEI